MPRGGLPGGWTDNKEGGKVVMCLAKKIEPEKTSLETLGIEIVRPEDNSALVSWF